MRSTGKRVLPAAVECGLPATDRFLHRPKFVYNRYTLIFFFGQHFIFIALYTVNDTSTFCKSMGSIALYVIYCATPQFIFYTLKMLAKDFYLIISSDESTTIFLIGKNVLANNENSQCLKCGSAMHLYLRIRREVRKGKFTL